MPASSHVINWTDKTVFRDNILVMEVENLLNGWPTYEINFTPQNPGPLKLLIRLKDAVKLVELEDSSDSEAEELLPGSKLKGRKTTSQSHTKDSESNVKDSSHPDVMQSDAGDSCYRAKTMISTDNCFHAKPVQLIGVLKDPVSRKRKFQESEWPPRRRRTYRHISPSQDINALQAFRTFPAAVAVAKANTTK
ncbi:hypothetical protein DEU56DRAFT_916649 [Suillus clintonianus]|uniref:uncharacterized protein n=1 Tax=Suillus clintonianus TaxID=1904413 RepID=UPI001B87C2C8|nr:uncharacterized protein DEU56DRAFT_916649 [Suillus clintonianus]KAG2125146.1 hypothetical protein DEU56DRAFT_916649 [Suillus clintonianus]